VLRVAILQDADNVIPDEGIRGTMDALAERGFRDGARLKIDRFNRYAEAMVEFENALRLMPRRDRSAVPSLLAFAYVAVGDESNAARVLREAGVFESKIPSDLDRFRATLRARK
jgi:hypothetical protein